MSLFLACPICCDACENAVQLSCSHVFCAACISALKTATSDPEAQVQHLVGAGEALPALLPATSAAEEELISCPVCRARVPVPGFVWSQEALERTEERNERLAHESLQIIKKCTKHGGKPITGFCQECPTTPLLCDDCLQVHPKAHKVCHLKNCGVSVAEMMKEVLQQTEKSFEMIQGLLDSTQEKIDEVSDDADKVCEGIRERAEKCIQRIRELEEEMVERVRTKQSEVCKTYELQLQDIETMESHMRLGKTLAEDCHHTPETDRPYLQIYSASLLKSTGRLISDYTEQTYQKITFSSNAQVRIFLDGAQEGPYASLGEVSVSKSKGNYHKAGSRVRGTKTEADVCKKSRVVMQTGTQGLKDGQFRRPIGIAVHPTTHQVYVSDFDGHKIQIFSASLEFVSKFGSMGSQSGMLNQPRGLAFNKRGDFLAVADSMNRRVQLFSTNGQFVSVVSRPSQLQRPTSLVFDAADRIYVADSLAKSIYLFSLDGNILRSFANAGAELSISFTPRHELCFVSLTKDSLEIVQVLDDAAQGTFDLTDRSDQRKRQSSIPIQPVQGSCSILCTSPDGAYLVADAEKKCIHVYSSEGRLTNTLDGTGQAEASVVTPGAMAYDSGWLFVCDTKAYRIVVF